MRELPDRIWAKIDKTDSCWLWTGGRTSNGYGKGYLNRRHVYVHRIVYEALVGDLEPGAQVDHRCHVKHCCNPAHLLPVDNTGNAQNRRGAQTNSRSGVRGVHWSNQHEKWRVQVKADGRIVSGGLFDSLDDASMVAAALRTRLMPNAQ